VAVLALSTHADYGIAWPSGTPCLPGGSPKSSVSRCRCSARNYRRLAKAIVGQADAVLGPPRLTL